MATIRIKGSSGLNDYFAETLIDDVGPDEARTKVCGPMLEAVERVIAARAKLTELEQEQS